MALVWFMSEGFFFQTILLAEVSLNILVQQHTDKALLFILGAQIPQESVLGLVLFNIFVKDMDRKNQALSHPSNQTFFLEPDRVTTDLCGCGREANICLYGEAGFYLGRLCRDFCALCNHCQIKALTLPKPVAL